MNKKATTKKINKETKTDLVKVVVQNLAGKKMGEMEVSGLDEAKVSSKLLAQIIDSNRNRQRIRRAHTKGRGEVRGGGKKPWKQKGTGRARHSSTRSPIWVGGGITFGPKAIKRAKLFTPKEMKQGALADVLARHIKAGNLAVVQTDKDIPLKTRVLAEQIGHTERILIVTSSKDGSLQRSARNLQYVEVEQATQVMLKSLMQARRVWVLIEAMDELERRIGGRIKLSVKSRSTSVDKRKESK
ncbi:MAG: 50S ribosomal protein L4 [Candidatus Andersenbacteria bacterium RIFCSPHIGHO2_12_FULL_46_9]|nr:MAG: 50S ribosomal protein L4 [Parcubacteria group bacterium GW2011_GWA2_45_14]OGY35624.1 MAG: 50S ribosomal protein L4 [Candidatus Andersenbacteria bacterium RIFCSPHIGHO2_02_FULL_46_16]OGY36827.1 MAG: 50S ribosomal protein L4 [Candidatus Andersenbacteria bacterium RIFCSPLOWO2_02_FULL_46_11]OGY37732.1 MAG: 50S ribosomal protein L4 [Candidatus Andersenbacteria bacterium RIFCSPHIGHO2_12_FULL_46_9]OGY41626.1 MAG: 50S ribosomal protein L4 [Candidatus Andersenbacteria bacterium RIFCSPLOWO2_12_FUL